MGGHFHKAIALSLLVLGTVGCTSLTDLSEGGYNASFSAVTAQSRALRAIAPPSKRVTVAVYDFPDLTGQYEEPENVQSLSRAVTQGGAPMLIKALQDAGERRWFSVLDRSNLEALVRERQIVTEMRRIYRGEERIDPDALAPLDHAGIILQGGIIGYDSNVMTGGFGARYLGIGGDRQWKLDIVTVSLRAVATNSGEVLASVVVRKPIASVSDRGSIFRYVALDELLEVEGGVATNEPKQVAVQQSIEKAVMALIAEGTALGIWHFENREAGQRYVARYRARKYQGDIPANARRVRQPDTSNPAQTVPTRPRRPQPRQAQVIERRVEPTPAAVEEPSPPPPPPPPEEGESVG